MRPEQDLAGEAAVRQERVVQVVRHAGEEGGRRISLVAWREQAGERGHDQAVVPMALRRLEHDARLAGTGGTRARLPDERLRKRRRAIFDRLAAEMGT